MRYLFYETFSLSLFASMIMAPMFFVLINKFITLWLGENFVLNNYTIICCTVSKVFSSITESVNRTEDREK